MAHYVLGAQPRLRATIMLAALLGAAPAPVFGQALPPPPRAGMADMPLALRLELVVNGRATQRVVPVTRHDGKFLLRRDDLVAVEFPAARLPGDEVMIDAGRLDGVAVRYDGPNQQLHFELPPAWLPHRLHSGTRPAAVEPLRVSPGALFNYGAYVSDARGGTTTANLSHDMRLFGAAGTLSTSGLYRKTLSHGDGRDDGYRRFDTRWEHADPERLVSYAIGDVITRPVAWSRAVRLGGVQISRDFDLRPDLVTHPLPAFSGEVAVPTTLDLFIDGTKRSTLELEPGAYTLADMPMVTGAGEAMVVTTDAQGQRLATSLPFYVSSELLRAGLSTYSVSAGALRQDFGRRDFAYGPVAAAGSFRRGISNGFTLELQAEASDDVAVAGVGGNFGLWRFGTLEAAYRHSRSDGSADEAYSTGYRYSSRRFNVGFRHLIEQAGFTDLASHTDRPTDEQFERKVSQFTVGVGLGGLGSLAGGYFDVDNGAENRTRLLSLSYSRALWGRMHLSLAAIRTIGSDWSATLQLTLPLQRHSGTLSSSLHRDRDGVLATRVDYGHSPPLHGGWGWNLGYENRDGSSDYRYAELAWRGRAAELRGGVFGTSEDNLRYAEARGSVVRMDGQWFAANRVRDGFVVVSTDGEPDVPVRYENQLVGRTSASGHLLVPWAKAYYPGKYEIDPLALATNVRAPEVEQRVALHANSGYLLRFPIKRVVAATFVLLDVSGEPLPVGSRVLADGGAASLVGWDGLTYLEDLERDERLAVTLPDGRQCRLNIALDPHAAQIQRLAPQTCR